jgi:hypothetical protein
MGDNMKIDNRIAAMNTTRRRVLQVIAAGGAMTLGGYPLTAMCKAGTAAAIGYGIDPNLFDPKVTWDKSLTQEQLLALRALGDIIIPADDHSPKASDLDIADFVNEWVSAPYPAQQQDRKTLLDGLGHLDRQATTLGAKSFAALDGQQQQSLFDRLAKAVAQGSASTELTRFFDRLVYLFVGGFYTTQQGMADIGYVGNMPMIRFDGPPAEIRKRLGL